VRSLAAIVDHPLRKGAEVVNAAARFEITRQNISLSIVSDDGLRPVEYDRP